MSIPKPSYRDKYPCAGCSTGYLDCAAATRFNLQCCAGCDHPARWLTDHPYTGAELAHMIAWDSGHQTPWAEESHPA